MRRVWRSAGLLLLLPISLSIWVAVITFWLGAWGGVHLVQAARSMSLPALSTSLDGLARSAGTASWVVRGWGSLATFVPAMEPVRQAGEELARASKAGIQLAPLVPEVLGANGPRRYLVCQLNDAELFGSGGAPLEATMVEVRDATLSFPVTGSVSTKLNPGNEPFRWDVLGGRPWYRERGKYPFANANFHPDFTYSGQNMIRAWEALGYPRLDGVITVDIQALATILQATGPIVSGDYGRLTSQDIVSKVLVEAYRRFPELDGPNWDRKEMNRQLRKDMYAKMVDRRVALRAALGIWRALPARHVQAYMVDPQLQEVVETIGADASLRTGPGDVLGVFAQVAPSKLAVFQQRRIRHEVDVLADGSARVRQVVRFGNAVPKGLSGDPDSVIGYLALKLRQRVAFRIPEAARGAKVSVAKGRAVVPAGRTGPFPDDRGARVLWQGQDVPRRGTSTSVVTYRLPKGTFGSAGRLRYSLTANPQAMVIPVELDVKVRFPDGTDPAAGPGWQVRGDTATWGGTLDRTVSLAVGG